MTAILEATPEQRRSAPALFPSRMREDDFVQWSFAREGPKVEWINGEITFMSPVNVLHFRADWFLLDLIGHFVGHHHLGEVFGPQTQIRLPNIVSRREPDVLFVSTARQDIIKSTFIDGPPDLIVEIVSPESIERDVREKYLEYEQAGVREYWIVNPLNEQVTAYLLNSDGKYQKIDEADGKINSTVVPGFYLRPAWLWQQPRVSALIALKELGVIG